jgi:hypothetical protein
MKLSNIPPRVAWPVAILAALGVFYLLYGVLQLPLWVSGLLAIVVFVGLYLVFDPRTQKQLELQGYEADAQARMNKVLDQLREIQQIDRKIPQGPVNQSVMRITQLAQSLLTQVQQKRPNDLISAVSAVDYRMGKLRDTLNIYVDILQDPSKQSQSKYADISQRISTQTLPALEQWLGNNLDRLNAGDILQLEVNLDQLEASQYEALK